MKHRHPLGVVALAFAALTLLPAFRTTRGPEDEFAGIVVAFLDPEFETGWEHLDQLPLIQWAALPPTSLEHCLPDLGCYTREGRLALASRTMTVVATGARTIVSNVYFRNASAPLGEAAVVSALERTSMSPSLVRCPASNSAGGTDWYRLTGARVSPGHLAVQTRCKGKPCEGFVLTRGEKLPPLQPNQLALYSEQCAEGSERKVVSTTRPPAQLAGTIKLLLPPAAGPASYDWKAMVALPSGIAWNPGGPKPGNMSYRGDPGPMLQSGTVTLAGREFSVSASGTATQVKTIYFEEMGTHPKGEHMLGVLYEKGLTVKLVRCGPVYTESTNNWYSATSTATRPVMIQQSIRYDGNQVQDSYALRLDGTLPARDPRDRNPGAGGC
jgi:hypothetical protein